MSILVFGYIVIMVFDARELVFCWDYILRLYILFSICWLHSCLRRQLGVDGC